MQNLRNLNHLINILIVGYSPGYNVLTFNKFYLVAAFVGNILFL